MHGQLLSSFDFLQESSKNGHVDFVSDYLPYLSNFPVFMRFCASYDYLVHDRSRDMGLVPIWFVQV